MLDHFQKYGERVEIIHHCTEGKEEDVVRDLIAKFTPKVVLVNHEKWLHVDTPAANLAIKYDMIYMSAYQVIRSNIENKTDFGEKLVKSRKGKEIATSLLARDDFREKDFSPVHYDMDLVMQLLKHTID